MLDQAGSAFQFWMAEASPPGKSTGVVVVEIIRKAGAADPHLVLLSERVEGRLECRMAFTVKPGDCDALNARGFSSIEALIRLEGRRLTVRAAGFPHGRRQIDYDHQWLVVTGVDFDAKGPGELLNGDYHQVLETPDLVLPAEAVRKTPVVWRLDRQDVTRPEVAATITVADLRWPKTSPLNAASAAGVWTGTLASETIWGDGVEGEARREVHPDGHRRSSFRAVEVLGVRLEIPRYDARKRFKTERDAQARQEEELYGLISPLNFHLEKSGDTNTPDRSRPDFYYRPATSALTVELLRYGRMSVAQPIDGLEPDDVQSQHELLVRLVVGRVDEDSSQAQEVATFVPVLFVDNTWSKHLGRRSMGLDKRLADFCTRDGEGQAVPLSPRDAYDRRDEPAPPLSRIAEIRLASELYPPSPPPPGVGDTQAQELFDKDLKMFGDARRQLMDDSPVLLSIDCDPDLIAGWDDFQPAPTDAVLRNSPLAGRRWRQEDFDDPEVRRDFARAAGQGSAGFFLGTQGSPLRTSDLYQERWATQTWVSGRYSMVGSATMARPRGVVRVTMHRIKDSPVPAWQHLCNLFEVPELGKGGERTFVLGPGSWYRLLYDMDLSLLNGVG